MRRASPTAKEQLLALSFAMTARRCLICGNDRPDEDLSIRFEVWGNTRLLRFSVRPGASLSSNFFLPGPPFAQERQFVVNIANDVNDVDVT
jgi:hypothetical protein